MSYREFGKDILGKIQEKYDEAYEAGLTKTCCYDYDEITLCFPGKNARRNGQCSYDCVVRLKGRDVSFREICEELTKFSSDSCIKNEVSKLIHHTSVTPIHNIENQDKYDSEAIDKFIEKNNLSYSVKELVDLMSFIGIIEEFNFPKYPGEKKYRGRKDCFGRYIESLYGGKEELNNIKNKLNMRGAQFKEQDKYKKYYCSEAIDEDRWHLDDFKSI